MARQLRIQFENATYHVMSNSIEEQRLFTKKHDFRSFLGILKKTQEEYGLRIFSYCLLTTHYHILLQTPLGNLGQAMQYLNGVYAMGRNGRIGRLGHLTRRRYNYRLVEDLDYFQVIVRYLALNPVKAGLVVNPEDWPYSSYRSAMGLSRPPKFLDLKGLLDMLSPYCGEGSQAYCYFMKQPDPTHWEFNEDMVLLRPTLSHIFRDVGGDEAIHEAVHRWKYRHAEVGDFLGISRSSVSKILKRFTKSA